MLTEVCRLLRNWFERDKIFGTFAVVGGVLTGTEVNLQPNQYYRIIGSVFNDGVHQQGETLTDEESFTGAVWLLAIPKEVVDLASEISSWIAANGSALNSPYQSESFGGYSYSLKSGGASGGTVTWQSQFASRLNAWRKV